MNNTLLVAIIVVFPVMAYLLYLAYKESFYEKENDLIFSLIIITQFYLIYKYGLSYDLLMINIPLGLSYYNKTDKLIIFSTIICMIYYLNFYYFLSIIEYSLYFLIYKKYKGDFINVFIIIKSVVMLFLNQNILVIAFIVLLKFTVYMLEKGRDMLKLNMSLKKIKKQSQIQKSLFQITHEIKNPIAVCKGYLDMYDENNIDKMKKNIPIIKEEIDRTLILLEDFLSLNRQKINIDLLDINYLLEEAMENMRLLFKKKKIKLISDLGDDELFISGDYNRLMQVFVNIFKNSMEALENIKNPEIEVRTIDSKKYVKIFIKDNGCGMSSEILDKIKEPFYTTKTKGTGLGVSLSDEIISAHGGKIKYSSKENEYTNVEIKLPKKVS